MTASHDLHKRLTDAILGKGLFRPGDTLIVGLSAGADSTALLDLLATLPAFPLRLVAAHLNHCLRGGDSDADELFCRDTAARYGIPFASRRVDVRAIAGEYSCGLEDAGRRARIGFFDELAATWKAAAVVLAHHADDQAETLLMRLLRGAGTSGLAGMSSRNGRGYVRPLLEITRAEIETYLTGRGLSWREDASNRDTAFVRNRIRHELLPLLESYNPSVRRALAATAGILSGEDGLLSALAAKAAEGVCRMSADTASCDIPLLGTYPIPLQRRIIRQMLFHTAGNLEHFTNRHVENILLMIRSERPNIRNDLPQQIVVVRGYDTLTIGRRGRPALEPPEIMIDGPGLYQLPDGSRILIALSPASAVPEKPATTFCFDADRAPFPWHVRTFRPGDRIRPLGMNGRKKVKNLFIDEKVPVALRTRIPLVFSAGELIWAVGLRTSHCARIDNSSSRIVTVVLSLPGNANTFN